METSTKQLDMQRGNVPPAPPPPQKNRPVDLCSRSQSKTEPPLLMTNKRTIYTAGRPPWYNVTGTTFKEAFVIGLEQRRAGTGC